MSSSGFYSNVLLADLAAFLCVQPVPALCLEVFQSFVHITVEVLK